MGRISESQNHRIVGVGRDLCGSSSPTPLPKQGRLQQAAQDLVQEGQDPCPGWVDYKADEKTSGPSGSKVSS